MKKKLLFVIGSIACGGAERALVALLNRIDYTQYEVDLMLLRKDDMYYEQQIPKEVRVLENDDMTKLCFDHVKHLIKSPLLWKKWNVVCLRVYQTARRKLASWFHAKKVYHEWARLEKHVPILEGEYDAAVAFLWGNVTYYVCDKVKAKRKISWIQCDYVTWGYQRENDLPYCEKLDCIFTVSEPRRESLCQVFPEMKDKIKVMYTVLDLEEIRQQAQEPVPLTKEDGVLAIVSTGNLRYVKGYDISIKAAAEMKKDGYRFKWYILGEGPERQNLEKLIQQYELQDYFVLLGLCSNPYQYLQWADIYAQSSRSEGFSTSVREAKVFYLPIVITDCPGMSEQIVQGETGTIVANGDFVAFAHAIEALLDSPELRTKYTENLKKDTFERDSLEFQIKAFYNEF